MVNISVSVNENGAVTPSNVTVGHVGEHNSYALVFTLPSALISSVDYFRVDFGGYLSKRLYAENGKVTFPLSQGLMISGNTVVQLEGIKIQDSSVSVVFKSNILRAHILYSISCNNPVPERVCEPLDSAIAELDSLLENAEPFYGLTSRAESAAKEAQDAAQKAQDCEALATEAMNSAYSSKEETLTAGANVADQFAQIVDMHSAVADCADSLKDAETNASNSAKAALEAQEKAETSASSAIAAKNEACALNQSIKDGINTLEIVEDVLSVLPGETVEKEVLSISNPLFSQNPFNHTCHLNIKLKANKKYRFLFNGYTEEVNCMMLGAGEYDDLNVVYDGYVTELFDFVYDPNFQFIYCDVTTDPDFPEDENVFIIFPLIHMADYLFDSLKIIDLTPRPTANTISPLVDNLYDMGATLEEIGNKVFNFFYRNPSPEWTYSAMCFNFSDGYSFNDGIEIEEGEKYTFKVSEKSGKFGSASAKQVAIGTDETDFMTADLKQNEDGYWETTFTAEKSYSGNIQIGVTFIPAEDTELDFGAVTLRSVPSVIDTIGDIGSCLDEIISIQEALISGGSA